MRNLEARLSSLLNFAPHTICLLNPDLTIQDINRSGLKNWGFKRKEIIGKKFMDFIPPGERKSLRKIFNEAARTGKALAITDVAVSPSPQEQRFMDLQVFRVGGGLGLIVTDITEKKRAEQAFREGETRFRELIERLSEAVLVLDEKGIVTYVNREFLERSGYCKEDIIGRTPQRFIAKEHIPHFKKQFSRRKKGLSDEYEIEVRLKGDQKALLHVSSAALHDDDGNFKGSIAVLRDITERRRFEEELNRSQKELRLLSQYLHTSRENESRRIAREIHDELGQALTTLKIGLSWLAQTFPGPADNQERILNKIKSMSELLGETVLKVQKISSELRPVVLDDLGLIPAIKWLAQDFQNRTKIRCRTSLESLDFELNPDCSIAIFRIMQEALTNVARHAQATRVNVSLKKKKKHLELKISDNGIGIKDSDITSSDSLGILGMRERILPFGAKFKLQGIPDRGTTLTITLPIERIQRA